MNEVMKGIYELHSFFKGLSDLFAELDDYF